MYVACSPLLHKAFGSVVFIRVATFLFDILGVDEALEEVELVITDILLVETVVGEFFVATPSLQLIPLLFASASDAECFPFLALSHEQTAVSDQLS